MMGMGEPLYNFDGGRDAHRDRLPTATASRCRGGAITLSTSGVVPKIERARRRDRRRCWRSRCTPTNDALRDQLVPLNRKYPIADAARRLPRLSRPLQRAAHHLRICDAEGRQRQRSPTPRELVRLLRGIPAKINLIPFNPWPGATYECSDWERSSASPTIVNRAGYASPVRTPRGRDILAACGQLKSASERRPGAALARLPLRQLNRGCGSAQGPKKENTRQASPSR